MPETADPSPPHPASLPDEEQNATPGEDFSLQLKQLQDLSLTYEQYGCFSEAAAMLKRACHLAQSREHAGALAQCLNQLGELLQRQNRFDEAISALQEGRNLAQAQDDPHRLGKILNSLGNVLRRQGWVDEATELFEYSYAVLAGLERPCDQLIVLINLAGMRHKQGNTPLAEQIFQHCLETSRTLCDLRYLAYTYTAMGKTLLDSGGLEPALSALSTAFELDEQLPHLNGLRIVLPNLVQVLNRLERNEEAVAYCRRALALAPDDAHFRLCVQRRA